MTTKATRNGWLSVNRAFSLKFFFVWFLDMDFYKISQGMLQTQNLKMKQSVNQIKIFEGKQLESVKGEIVENLPRFGFFALE